jgi:hypothetical protein
MLWDDGKCGNVPYLATAFAPPDRTHNTLSRQAVARFANAEAHVDFREQRRLLRVFDV